MFRSIVLSLLVLAGLTVLAGEASAQVRVRAPGFSLRVGNGFVPGGFLPGRGFVPRGRIFLPPRVFFPRLPIVQQPVYIQQQPVYVQQPPIIQQQPVYIQQQQFAPSFQAPAYGCGAQQQFIPSQYAPAPGFVPRRCQ